MVEHAIQWQIKGRIMVKNNIYVYELNGEKMILDVELTAKPISDEFWILTDGERKVGNVCANNVGTFNVNLQNEMFEFESISKIQKKTNIKFVVPKETVVKAETPYPEYPHTARTYNSVYDVKRGLHVFTKTKKSKCFHAAGYFVVEHNGINQVIFCPKYIFIQRYPYKGPFKTKEEAKNLINI
jgi:hypothetical protein|tara:strand:+ start:105 stop:656 length:552 start_codon:yes stop_codon:yes gene_type:complete